MFKISSISMVISSCFFENFICALFSWTINFLQDVVSFFYVLFFSYLIYFVLKMVC